MCRRPKEHMDIIETLPKPETIAELGRFSGMVNYYRYCIPHLAEIQTPLNRYLKKINKK